MKLNLLNKKLAKLTTNFYFEWIPLEQIGQIFRESGINEGFLNGVYCGREGRTHEQIPNTNLFFTMTWYKMASGRYEIVCYVN